MIGRGNRETVVYHVDNTPAIRFENVCIGYNKNPVLENLNCMFYDNKIYGILGESGVGKTTLLRTIAGLNKPIKGKVYINSGYDIYMMHQQYTCFDWLTCVENILITARVKHMKITDELRQTAIDILNRVGLTDPYKYPTELSGGMRQRLALARTLFVKPKIILMDEPLSALDEETRENMQNLIMENHKQTNNIIILITHSSSEAKKMCDLIINISKKGIEYHEK